MRQRRLPEGVTFVPGAEYRAEVKSLPTFAELPDGYPHKYILLTMDRVNFPGMPTPNWTYGGLQIYVPTFGR